MTFRSQNRPAFPRLFTYRSDSEGGPERRWPDLPSIPLGWRLFGLVLLCLIPRVLTACVLGSICDDGYYYITIASAFAHGHWSDAFAYLDLNVYPVILLGLNSLGLEWILAGKVWSILVSTLAVLPLFGWVRRMFSDQVAWAAGFLYSLHAEFVELSFEPIRDPTFWFLFNLCLYTMVRAISEVKYRWFLANGVVLTLAIHTRSEGWLLTIPLFLWLARQLAIRVDCRKKLLAGGAMSLAVLPAMILVINLTVLRDQPEWQFGRLSHFAVGWKWIQERLPAEEPAVAETSNSLAASAPVEEAPIPPAVPPPKPPRAGKYFKDMASALEQINLGLLVFGLFWSGRELIDWDRGTLFVLAFALAAAVWILFDHYGHLNGRYFLPIYLTLIPFCGIGYLLVFYGLWNFAERSNRPWLRPEYTAVFLIVLAIGLGWADALTTNYERRQQEQEFGAWLEETHGPFHSVITDSESIRAAYRANRDVPNVLPHWSTLPTQYADFAPDLLILGCQATPPEARGVVDAEVARRGLVPLSLPEKQEGRGLYLVFVRPREAAETPQTAARSSRETRRE